MKPRLFVVVLILFFGNLSRVCLGLDKSPLGSGRVPASANRSGLVRSPNPINRSGNLVVTGNVGGGKHFRGVVPYQSTTDFGVPLSTSVVTDPFLRRSVSSGDYIHTSGRTPYYSLARTVTRMIPGSGGKMSQPTLKGAKSAATSSFALPVLPKERVLYKPEDDISLRPMSRTRRQLEKVLLSDVEKYLEDKKLKAEQFKEDEKGLRDDLGLPAGITALKEDVSLKESPGIEAPAKAPDLWEQFKIDKEVDVYDLMQKQLEVLQEDLEASKAKEGKKDIEGDEEAGGSALDEFSEEEISIKAKTLLGKHKTFSSYSTSKFNQYMLAGEEHLKRGEYYWAADAYTMASIYKPADPLVYAGKSLALFAAGEYMSSALFLARTLEMFPEYAYFRVDFAEMLGSKDVLDQRIADIRRWASNSQAPELRFLLAYVFYQMDQREWSNQAIKAAHRGMPESVAVSSLKKAIETMLKQEE